MRICVIGKFPPIQGGVSTRTYWTAHSLAAGGHEVHVVTNANEVRAPFRMYMRPEDWNRCEAVYDRGSVMVHWTDPVDASQSYIPMASPFVSKLAGVAARLHSNSPFDVLYSYYMEPYGVAGHLTAQMIGVPHVVRLAGSDAGRLWRHPQLEALYDHVLRSAELVITAGTVAERAIERGVSAERIASGGGFVLPEDLFTPNGPAIDLAALRTEIGADPDFRDLQWGDFRGHRPHFGIYGKLGENKGSFALLDAMQRLKADGMEVGLVALAHGAPSVDETFRARARHLGLADRIHHIPFLPHWRVPEFLRSCLAVCCLEQDFPIEFHTPLITREVLLCGVCLVASTEIIRKLSPQGGMAHGYNCVAIEDVNNIDVLSKRLAAIVRNPVPVAAVGARGRAFMQGLQKALPPTETLERLLEAAASRRRIPPIRREASDATADGAGERFLFTRRAEAMLSKTVKSDGLGGQPGSPVDLARACEVLAAIERDGFSGNSSLDELLPAVRVEIAVVKAESEIDGGHTETADPLFRLHLAKWALEKSDLAGLLPFRSPLLRVLEFDGDVAEFGAARSTTGAPLTPPARKSYIIAFGCPGCQRPDPLLIDEMTARILELSDGSRTVADVIRDIEPTAGLPVTDALLDWIESLFARGLIHLREAVDLTRSTASDGSLAKV